MKLIDRCLVYGNPTRKTEAPSLGAFDRSLERCAATETPGAFDTDLTNAIIQEEKRNLLADFGKLFPERLAAAVQRLPAEKRNSAAEIEQALTKEIEALFLELEIDNPKVSP